MAKQTTKSTKFSERVLWLDRNYMHLFFEEGMSVKEIAQKAGLHPTTVYHRLEAIAKENNMCRSELLTRKSSKHSSHLCKLHDNTPPPKVEDVESTITEILALCDKVNTQIAEIVEEVENDTDNR